MRPPAADFAHLPGGDLIVTGLADLARGAPSTAALLVALGAPRLRLLGVPVPDSGPADPERALYDLLAAAHGDAAHGRYNALVRRLVSFARALAVARRADAPGPAAPGSGARHA